MPLGLHTPASDVDILCHAPDLGLFEAALREAFGGRQGFTLRRLAMTPPALVARFVEAGTPIEVFGQGLPAYAQLGYRHMLVEGRLLRLGGPALRERVL